jgi:uncharacterized protein YigA (DUF484 family)
MGSVHSFEASALAQLRARLGAAEEVNQDLIAFARGHWGAVASIHRAVLAAIEADGIAELAATVVDDWPEMLGIDSAALLFPNRGDTWLATGNGVQAIDPALLRAALRGLPPVTMRTVQRGHAMFGKDAPAIRAEALIRLDCSEGGRLLLGQTEAIGIEDSRGFDLLMFLGRSLAAMVGRCADPKSS